MARRKRRTTTKSNLSGRNFIILIVLLLGIYAYEQGYFDRLIDNVREITGMAPEPTAGPATSGNPDPATSGDPGTAAALPKANSGSGSWFQVYFTKPSYPERSAERQGGIDEVLVRDIDAAESSVDIAVFDHDVQSITDALIRAHERGVQVRLVIDGENLEAEEVQEQTDQLEGAGIPITFDEREAFMHNKFMVVDKRVVWTGSTNFTYNDVYRNNNNMQRFEIPQLTANYERRFGHLFAGQLGSQAPKDTPNPSVTMDNGVTIMNFFSPGSGADKEIVRRLQGAEQSIYMLAFAFTADPQAEALIERHNAGVTVQAVMESRNANGSGSDFELLNREGVELLKDGNCYIMHHKVYIIDERTVITGSYNFSNNAERNNDENLLIIDDPDLARLYLEEFRRVYDHARNPTQCG